MYCNLNDQPDVLIYNYEVLSRSGTRFKMPFSRFSKSSTQLANTFFNAAWTKAIKTKKLKKFLEGCMRGEDTYMWLQVLDGDPSIKQIEDCLYIYRMHGKNITFSSVFQEDRKTFINALKKMLPGVKDKWVALSIRERCGL